jgi:hypothetical protein
MWCDVTLDSERPGCDPGEEAASSSRHPSPLVSTARSSNGKTPDSESGNTGSNPVRASIFSEGWASGLCRLPAKEVHAERGGEGSNPSPSSTYQFTCHGSQAVRRSVASRKIAGSIPARGSGGVAKRPRQRSPKPSSWVRVPPPSPSQKAFYQIRC